MKKIKFILLLLIFIFIPTIQLNAQTVYEYACENNQALYNLESDEPEILEAYRSKILISDEITAKAKEITKDCTTDMQKLEAIHDWIATNIYYDHYGWARDNVVIMANSVYEKRGTVCEGYANLTAAMCRAVEIPCKVIVGWAYEAENGGQEWTGNPDAHVEDGHAWNHAYIDGRWLILDTTWDSNSKNTVNDAAAVYLPCRKTNFDISLQELSKERIMLSVPLDIENHKLNMEVRDGKITATWNQLFDIANYTLQYSTSESGPFEEYKMTFNECQISVNTNIFSADTMYFRVIATEDGIIEVPTKVVAFALPQYTVTFMDGTNVVLTQQVKMGNNATPPVIQKEGYDLSWDMAYTNVVSDITVNTVWTKKANGTKVTTKKPAKVTGLAVKNKKPKQLVINWKKQKKADGYQIQIATNKNFKKGKKTKVTYTNKLTWKGLKKGKTYYIRVRAYKYGEKHNKMYGAWSREKKMKVKR